MKKFFDLYVSENRLYCDVLGKKLFTFKVRQLNDYPALINFHIDFYKKYTYLNKYIYVLNKPLSRKIQPKSNIINSKTNYQMWLQGVDQAPELVKCCMKSVRENCDNVFIFTKENICDFVDVPDYILQKWKKGQMANAHFSDYVRLLLLYNYGGTWIDATILMTNKMPTYITSSELFVFSSTPELMTGIPLFKANNSFFHVQKPGNVLLGYMLELLEEYWRNEEQAIHYSFFHLLWSLAINNNTQCKKDWEKVPFYSDINFHLLHMEINEKYNEKRIMQIKEFSALHKLSRLFCYEKEKHRDSNLEHILKNNL